MEVHLVELNKEAFNPSKKEILRKFLHQFRDNPGTIEPSLLKWLQKLDVKDEENDNDAEEKLHLLENTLDLGLSIISGQEDHETVFKDLTQQGVITSSVCGTIWKDGGTRNSIENNSNQKDSAYKCTTCELDSSW